RCGPDVVVTPLVEMSHETRKWSFGKLLEVFFYNLTAHGRRSVAGCTHSLHRDHILWFGSGDIAARFEWEPAKPYHVHVPSAATLLEAGKEEAKEDEVTKALMKSWELATLFFQRFQERLSDMREETRNVSMALETLLALEGGGGREGGGGKSSDVGEGGGGGGGKGEGGQGGEKVPGVVTPRLGSPTRIGRGEGGEGGKEGGKSGLTSETASEFQMVVKEIETLEGDVRQFARAIAECLSTLMEECSSIKNKNNNDCREEEEEEEEGGEAGKEGVSAERIKKGKDENEEGEEEAVVVEEGEKEELPPHPSRRARRKMTPAERALYPTQCQRQVYLQVLAWNERLILSGRWLQALKAQAAMLVAAAGGTSLSTPPSAFSQQLQQQLQPLLLGREKGKQKEKEVEKERGVSSLNPSRSIVSDEGQGDEDEGEDGQEGEEGRGEEEDMLLFPPSVEEEEEERAAAASTSSSSTSSSSSSQNRKLTRKDIDSRLMLPPPPKPRVAISGNSSGVDPSLPPPTPPHAALSHTHSLTTVLSASASMGKNSLASALVRLLGGKENAEGSPYAVELEDILAWVGRLGLEPLPNGGVIPVVEEMASTIISYALSCQEYRSRFREFQTLALRRHDSPTSAPSPPSSPPPPGQRSGDRKTRKEREEKEAEEDRGLERLMLYPEKSHIKIKFQDVDPH
ncbi:hypothetical protein VYU27_010022, partial [Nannochloropsis oceanica]